MILSRTLVGFVSINRSAAKWFERKWPSLFGGESYRSEILSRIRADLEGRCGAELLEVGGIDRPLLTRNATYRYVGMDIEYREACEDVYDDFIVRAIELPLERTFDLIVSFTLLEHVQDNQAAIKNVAAMLREGGATHHYVPSRWHPYSIILRIVGPRLQRSLIAALRPDARDVTGYAAYFDHCSPAAMRRLFGINGFEAIDIRPFYRASDYFAFFLPAFLAVTAYENLCRTLHLTQLSSGFIVSARKASAPCGAP